MNKYLRFLIIPLLVAAILSLGIAWAGTDDCPPDCGHHAGTVSAVPSCCEAMDSGSSSGHMPKNSGDDQRSAECGDGFYCRGSEPNEAVAVFTVPGLEPVVLFPTAVPFSPPSLPEPYHAISLRPPPPGQTPAIYTLNCSYLI